MAIDLTIPPFDPNNHYPQWTDCFNRVWRPGDMVMYSTSYGSSSCIKIAFVKQINKTKKDGSDITERVWNSSTRDWATIPSCAAKLLCLGTVGQYTNNFSFTDSSSISTVGGLKILAATDLSWQILVGMAEREVEVIV